MRTTCRFCTNRTFGPRPPRAGPRWSVPVNIQPWLGPQMGNRCFSRAAPPAVRRGAPYVRGQLATGRASTDVPVSPHRVTHLVALKDGGFAFGTAGASFGVVDASHRRILYLEPPPTSSPRPESRHADTACRRVLDGMYRPGKGPASKRRIPPCTWEVPLHRQGGCGRPGSSLRFSVGVFGRAGAGKPDGNYGYIDRAGRLAIPVQFADARDFSGGRAAVQSGDLVGYIDATGQMAIPARYSVAGDFSGGLAQVLEYGREHFGYINVLGQTVIAPRFKEARDFRDGVAAVRLNGRWGSNRMYRESGSPPHSLALRSRRPWRRMRSSKSGDHSSMVGCGDMWTRPRRSSFTLSFTKRTASRKGLRRSVCQPTVSPPFPSPSGRWRPRHRPQQEQISSRCLGPVRYGFPTQTSAASPDLHDKVVLLSREHRYHEAIGPAREALDTVELWLSRDDPALIRPLWDLGRVHHALANYRAFIAVGAVPRSSLWREARDHFQRALALIEHSQGAYHPDAGELASELGDLLASQREFNLAMDMKQRALAIARKTSGDRSVTALKAANDLRLSESRSWLLRNSARD